MISRSRGTCAVELRGALGRTGAHLVERLDQRRTGKRCPACQQGVEDRAQAVDVGRRRERAPGTGRLLGRHVRGGPHRRARLRQLAVALDALGQPEVGDVRLAVLVQQDIGRLQVAMENAALVGMVNGLGDDGDNRAAARGSAANSASRLSRLVPSISFMLKKCRPSCWPTS